jgi:hypothetical protein
MVIFTLENKLLFRNILKIPHHLPFLHQSQIANLKSQILYFFTPVGLRPLVAEVK